MVRRTYTIRPKAQPNSAFPTGGTGGVYSGRPAAPTFSPFPPCVSTAFRPPIPLSRNYAVCTPNGRGFTSARALTVALADGRVIRIQVEAADIEDAFEAFRLEAFHAKGADAHVDVDFEPPADFAEGENDIVLFTGATWSEPGSVVNGDTNGDSTLALSGHPGVLSETAEAVCLTTDAIVIAAKTGTGLLVRTGLAPNTLEVVRDSEAIAKFLVERGYAAA